MSSLRQMSKGSKGPGREVESKSHSPQAENGREGERGGVEWQSGRKVKFFCPRDTGRVG